MLYNCRFKLPQDNSTIEMKKIPGPELRKKLTKLLNENYYWTKKMSTSVFHILYKRLTDQNSKRKIHALLLNIIYLERA